MQRVLNNMDPKKPIPKHIIIKMAKLKDKERILKVAEKSSYLHTKELQLDCHLISHQKHFRPEGIGVKNSKR